MAGRPTWVTNNAVPKATGTAITRARALERMVPKANAAIPKAAG